MNQMRSLGDNIAEQAVVSEVLRSLAPRYDYVVAVIEEAKDLS